MLNLLFRLNALYDVVLAVVIIALLIIMVKWKTFRTLILSIILILFLALSTFAGFNVNNYYTASGGIFGEISDLVKPKVEILDNLQFELQNIALSETGKKNEYAASLIIDNITIPNGEKELLINNTPTNITNRASEFISAYYKYVFYDSDLKEIACDSLFIKISFFKNSTIITVSTAGGEEMVKLWNFYFNNNKFILKIKLISGE